MKRGVMLLLILGMMTGTSRAGYIEFTGPTAYADFLAATTNYYMEPVIDFEGDHGGFTTMSSYSENGVTFKADNPFVLDPQVALVDDNATFEGAPFESDILCGYTNGSSLLAVTLPDDTEAVGAYFGELVDSSQTANGVTHIVLKDTSGGTILDKTYSIDEMGDGGTFIGWTSDVAIGSIEHDLDSEPYWWSALDNFHHGLVPEPGSVVMLISGCLCALGLAWRRRQRQS